MKVLKQKERGYHFFSEKLDLNGVYAGRSDIPIGVLLIDILSSTSDAKFIELSAEEEGEIGEPHNILILTRDEPFPKMEELAEMFKKQNIAVWEMKIEYQGAEIIVSGRTYGTILSVRTPLETRINVLPLFNAVENETFKYHIYNAKFIEKVTKKFQMNLRTAVQSVIKLQTHEDILAEFKRGMSKEPFDFETENPVSAEGYTAKMLFEKYPLSELGAFNYLIYLRESPREALSDLKKGLPRK